MASASLGHLLRRQSDGTKELLELLKNPFSGEVRSYCTAILDLSD